MVASAPPNTTLLMVALADDRLGTGLYTVAEAAMYARVSPVMLARWLFGSPKGANVIDPQYADGRRDVGFLDLIQALAVRQIRLQRPKVSLTKVRQAIETARRNGVEYPFARQHVTFLLGDEIVIRTPLDEIDEFIEACGRDHSQRCFRFVEMYLQRLDFGEDGLAKRFHIFKSDHPTPVEVVMDPERRFGEPLLPSGYTALTIWDAFRAEGDPERTAKLYGIPRAEVEAACQFATDHLGVTAA